MGLMQQMFSGIPTTAGALIPPVTTDSFFNYVSLLLTGNGNSLSPNLYNNNSFVDSSTNQYTINKTGTPTQGTVSPYSQTGWSGLFNGTTDYLQLANNAAFNLGSSDFTVEAWIKLNALGAEQAIIGKHNNQAGGGEWLLELNSSNLPVFHFSSTGSNLLSVTGTVAMTIGSWIHIAVTRSGSTFSIYVNGTLDVTATNASAIYSSTTPLNIGRYLATAASTALFDGYISNARVVKGTAIYTGNFTPSTTPLTSVDNTSLLTLQNNRFIDNSPNSFVITVGGSASTQTPSPFAPNSSYTTANNGGSTYLNGSSYLSLPVAANNKISNLAGKKTTIEFWARTTTIQAITAYVTGVFGNDAASAVNGRYSIGFIGSSTVSPQAVRFYYTTSISTGASVTTTASIPQNTWNHIAVTIDATTSSSSTVVIYINGVGQTFTGVNLSTHTTDPGFAFNIGKNLAGDQSVSGYLTDFRLVQGSSLVYTGNFTPPTTPLTVINDTSVLVSGSNTGIFDNASSTDLTLYGTTTLSEISKYGTGSVYFNASGDYATIMTPIYFGTADFTIETWWKSNGPQTNYAAIASMNFTGSPAAGSWALKVRSGSNIVQFTYHNGTGLVDVQGTSNVNDGNWHHIAVTKSGTTLGIFVDGVLQTTAVVASNVVVGSKTINTLLGYQSRDSAYLKGYVDDLRITNGIARYTTSFTPPTSAFPTR